MRTIAIIALLTGSAITDLSAKYIPPIDFNQTQNELLRLNNKAFIDASNFVSSSPETAKVLVASGIAFWVGAIYLFMPIFQLGIITQLLTETFVNGFTSAYACHVFTSQLKSLFGISLTTYTVWFKKFIYNQ